MRKQCPSVTVLVRDMSTHEHGQQPQDAKKGLLSFTNILYLALSWATPRRQLRHLLTNKDNTVDSGSWEAFRDGLMRRWTNLNLIVRCPLPPVPRPSTESTVLDEFDHGVNFDLHISVCQ